MPGLASLSPKARFGLRASAVYAALALLVFRALASETFFGGDIYKFFLPVWIETTSQLQQGIVPAWNPSWSCGAPLLGGFLPSALYPPVIACAWFPPSLGFSLCIALHPPFAALGFALFLRRQGLGAMAAIVGGAAFGFGGFFLSLSSISPAALYVVSWSGWLLFLLDRLLKAPSAPRAAALGLAGGMVVLAGEPQYALHLALLLVGWLILGSTPGKRIRGLLWVGLSGVVAVLIACAVLLPALEVMSCGERSAALPYDYAASWPLLPQRLLTLVSPDLFGSNLHGYPNPAAVLTQDGYPFLPTIYMGAIPLLALLAAPWAARGRAALLFAIAALAFLLVALGSGFGLHYLLYETVPVYDRFRFPYKAWPGAALGFAGLAAFGLDGLSREHKLGSPLARRAALICGAIALACVLLAALKPPTEAIGASLAAGFPPALGALLAERLQESLLVVGVCAFLAAFALSSRCPHRASRTLLGSLGLVELAFGVSIALATAPVALIEGPPPSDPGLTPLRVHMAPASARFAQMQRFETLPEYVQWATSEAMVANGARWQGREHFKGNDKAFAAWHEQLFRASEVFPPESKVRLLATCGVDLLTTTLPPTPGLERQRSLGGGLYLSELEPTFPRAFWVPEAKRVETQADALRLLLKGQVDLGRVALIPSEAALAERFQGDPEPGLPADLDLTKLPGPRWSAPPVACVTTHRQPNEVRIRAPGEAGVVVLLDTYFPGWVVEVDGQERQLLRANYAFRGVEVSAADKEVVFRYAPARLTWGLGLACLGLALALVLALLPRFQRWRARGAGPG